MMPIIRPKTYSELIRYSTFDDRFNYADLRGRVGDLTHGDRRYLNQGFYTSREWRIFRNEVIERDDGCDLGIPDRPILGPITIHHLEPITVEMLTQGDPRLMSLDNVICVSDLTHKALHYGRVENTPRDYEPRRPGDTILWRSLA